MDKSHKKLKQVIVEDPSDKKKIKKKLKKIRKKLKETMEEVDGKRLKRLETIEEVTFPSLYHSLTHSPLNSKEH